MATRLIQQMHSASRESFEQDENMPAPPTAAQCENYISNICEFARLVDGVLVVASIYLSRLLARTPELVLTSRNWESLLCTAILLASKIWDDLSLVNVDFASFLPFSLQQINEWERRFLQGLEYRVSVSAQEYAEHLLALPSSSPEEALPPSAGHGALVAARLVSAGAAPYNCPAS
jgi:hypothetical protein